MPIPVPLNDVVLEMEALDGGVEATTFLNFRTGEIDGGTQEQLLALDDADDASFPDWQRESNERLRGILDSTDWLELPKPSTQEDYERMESFCFDRCEEPLREQMLEAITGPGAFRRFRDMLSRHGLWDRWNAYRRERIVLEAKAWLEENAIPYTEGNPQAPLPKS